MVGQSSEDDDDDDVRRSTFVRRGREVGTVGGWVGGSTMDQEEVQERPKERKTEKNEKITRRRKKERRRRRKSTCCSLTHRGRKKGNFFLQTEEKSEQIKVEMREKDEMLPVPLTRSRVAVVVASHGALFVPAPKHNQGIFFIIIMTGQLRLLLE